MPRRPGAGPTKAALLAARGATIPDVVPAGAGVVFCGINPSLYSAAVGHHFARPGNRFWKALHMAGFTDRLFSPAEDGLLAAAGIGITNLVARATATAAELTGVELREGAAILTAKLERWRPRFLAVVGIGAYRTAFGQPGAGMGPVPEPLAGPRSGSCRTPAGSTPTTSCPSWEPPSPSWPPSPWGRMSEHRNCFTHIYMPFTM